MPKFCRQNLVDGGVVSVVLSACPTAKGTGATTFAAVATGAASAVPAVRTATVPLPSSLLRNRLFMLLSDGLLMRHGVCGRTATAGQTGDDHARPGRRAARAASIAPSLPSRALGGCARRASLLRRRRR